MNPTFVIERFFPVRPERLFLAHSNENLLADWFVPPGAQTIAFDLDFRAGGSLRFAFEANGGPPIWGRLDYLKVRYPTEISLIHSLTDANGEIISPLTGSDWLLRVKTNIAFKVEGAGAKLRTAASLHQAEMSEQGFFVHTWPQLADEYNAALDRLGAVVGHPDLQ